MTAAAPRWEITDLLWSFDPEGRRRPVRRDDVVARLTSSGQRRAAAVVRRMPVVDDDVLAPAAVDDLGRRVHCELQRLGEELQLPRRIAHHLRPRVDELRRVDPSRPVTVVDVGCGLGHVVRWLAATGALGPGVDLVGADLNPVLVAEAARLAACEQLACRFVCADAFDPHSGVTAEGSRTLVMSSGVLHHLPAGQLPEFFAGQARLGVAAFAHWDIAPCGWSTLGAWVFHRARMREPVSRHDGVLSARRAHPAALLTAAAAAGAPGYDVAVLEGPRWYPRALDVLRPVVGSRRRPSRWPSCSPVSVSSTERCRGSGRRWAALVWCGTVPTTWRERAGGCSPSCCCSSRLLHCASSRPRCGGQRISPGPAARCSGCTCRTEPSCCWRCWPTSCSAGSSGTWPARSSSAR